MITSHKNSLFVTLALLLASVLIIGALNTAPAAVFAGGGGGSGGGGGGGGCGNTNENAAPGNPGNESGTANDQSPSNDNGTGTPVCNVVISQCISAANICGDVNIGTQNSCNSEGCSASTPPNPTGTCEVATECGVPATGFIGCNEQCNITSYPICDGTLPDDPGTPIIEPPIDPNEDPDDSEVVTWVVITDPNDPNNNVGVADVAVVIEAEPSLVRPGGFSIVRWISTEAESCTVTGGNGDSWTGNYGSKVTSAILGDTTYTIACTGFDGSGVTDTTRVRVVPAWQEF